MVSVRKTFVLMFLEQNGTKIRFLKISEKSMYGTFPIFYRSYVNVTYIDFNDFSWETYCFEVLRSKDAGPK